MMTPAQTDRLVSRTLTVGHLRDELRKYPDTMPVVLFTAATAYTIQDVTCIMPEQTQLPEPVIGLVGGWATMKDV